MCSKEHQLLEWSNSRAISGGGGEGQDDIGGIPEIPAQEASAWHVKSVWVVLPSLRWGAAPGAPHFSPSDVRDHSNYIMIAIPSCRSDSRGSAVSLSRWQELEGSWAQDWVEEPKGAFSSAPEISPPEIPSWPRTVRPLHSQRDPSWMWAAQGSPLVGEAGPKGRVWGLRDGP